VTARWFFGVALLLGLIVTSVLASVAEETPTRVFRVGIVSGSPRSHPANAAFEDRLRELGYVEGRSLTIDFVQDNDPDRLMAAVGEFARHGVDVIVVGQDAVLKAAITATAAGSTPVVFRAVDYDVAGEDQREAVARAASALGGPLEAIELRDPPYDYEHALSGTDGARGDALMTTTSGFNRPAAAGEAALRHRLPAIGTWRQWVEAGFLMSYGPNLSDMFRLSADYVDKILKGEKPADLPVQQPTRFELIVNLKTAKALGLTVPPSILARADEVIE